MNKPTSQMTEEEFKKFMWNTVPATFLKLGPEKVHELYKIATKENK